MDVCVDEHQVPWDLKVDKSKSPETMTSWEAKGTPMPRFQLIKGLGDDGGEYAKSGRIRPAIFLLGVESPWHWGNVGYIP